MTRPNFVFILADDLGYADLGFTGAHFGHVHGVSPNLDRMAGEGLVFTDGYSNSSVCSPTRFALITGRYQYRIPAAADEPLASRARGVDGMGLAPDHPTFASLLRDAGYSTALFGKWHLGYPPHYGPLKSGYQRFFGSYSGGLDYFSHCDPVGRHDLWSDESEVFSDTYFTDLVSEKTVEHIEGQSGAVPFAISVHYTAPHWPWETREDREESKRIGANIRHPDGGSLATYHRMIHHMDEGIGRIFDALERGGHSGNTLVVFTSDNGGERYSDVWPFIGGKMDLLEGGIRVPLVARWPARIRAGSTTGTPVITMDWAATMLSAAGVAPHPDYPPDGIDLAPLFADSAWDPRRPLYWRMTHRAQRAMRDGAWKYLAMDGNEYLFDLARDARERANAAGRDPDRLAAMRRAWERWAATMPAIPAAASVHLVYDAKVLPKPTH